MEQDHIALYRRFRPQTFDEITSQDAAVKALKQAVKSGKIGHAYMFAGQRGTGKTTIAKVFSRAINCLNPKDGNPCNECEVCKGILSGALLDVIEIDAASNNGVENVRRICDEAVFAPTKARYKVYIIDEVHMLSTGAYNALLKTLEEPPKHVVFLFATTEPHKILPTILSRCQKYYFKRIPNDLIVSRLRFICDKEGIKADDDALKQIAALSDGALRDAISLLDQAAGVAQGTEITAGSVQDIAGTADTALLIEAGDVLIDGNYESLLRICAKISESGRDYVRFTLDLAEFFRDLLVIRVVPDPTELVNYSANDMKLIYQTANKANPDTLIGFISYFSKMASDLKLSPSVRSSFETGLIRICGRKTSLPITPLVIPDFEKKQADWANKVSGAAEETKKESKTEEEPVKRDIMIDENTAKVGSFVFNVKKDELSEYVNKPEEPKKEVKKESHKPAAEESAVSVSERLEQLRASLNKPKTEEEKPEEPKPAAEPAPQPEEPRTIITAHPEVDENKPLENQLDLFSSLEKSEEPKPETEVIIHKEEKKEEPKEEPKSKIGISGLSDSFIDDVKPEKKESEKKPKQPQGKTSLSAVYDKSGLIVGNPHVSSVRQPDFGDSVPGNLGKWQSLLRDLALSNPNLHRILMNAEFMTIEENGYIVFEDTEKSIVENLKGMNEFRRLAQTIKSTFDNISRLFVCTKTQYGNAVAQHEKQKKQSAAEDMRAKAEQMGITTELHFGDD
ncbi:MAG: DNA polymerase III subunit gamma/tau [Clostridiales bacterium]|nr:DNA polymerase III subunit gamma/tau [Clostridiales bacterium]